MTLEEMLGRLDDPAFRDPQRFDPDCRFSAATAIAVVQCIADAESKGLSSFIERQEVERGKRILYAIIAAPDTEERLIP